VSDYRGALYNKDAIIEFLLPPDASGDGNDDEEAGRRREEAAKTLAGSVAALRDVVEVHFTLDAEEPSSTDADADADSETAGPRWVCPVSRRRLRAAPAVYLVPCGHALAASVVRELEGAGEELACPICATPCGSGNVIPILSALPADEERLERRMAELKARGLAHSLKKVPGAGKKRKKKDAQAAAAEENGEAKQKEETNGRDKAEAGIKNASTASLTAKVLEEQETRNKKRKLQRNDNLESLFSSREAKPPAKRNDFLSRGFTMS
jgi:hypothetical protein